MKKNRLKGLMIVLSALSLTFSLIACGVVSDSDSGNSDTSKLSAAINSAKNEYSYSLKVTSGGVAESFVFSRSGKDYKLVTADEGDADLYYVNGERAPYIVSYDGVEVKTFAEGDSDYDGLFDKFVFVRLENLSSKNYVLSENGYEPYSKTARSDEIYALTGMQSSDCEKMTVKLSDASGLIKSIVIEFTGETESIYDFEFYDYEKASFTVPSVNKNSSISAVYSAKIGDTVDVDGIVVGKVGNSFYLSDGSYGVYVYSSSSTACEKGDYLSMSGTVGYFKDYGRELTQPKNIQVLEKNRSLEPKSIVSFDYLENYLAMNVSIGGLSVSDTLKRPSSGSDYSFYVSDGTNEVKLFLSKYLPQTTRVSVYTALKGLKSDDSFSLTDVVAGFYNGSYQLEFTDSTKISVDAGTPVGLKTDKTELNLTTGTAFSDVKEKIVVYLEYDNGLEYELSSSDFDIECKNYDANAVGSYTVTVTYGEFSATFTVRLTNVAAYERLSYGDKSPLDTVAEQKQVTRGLPSSGSPKVLVIPVEIEDYPAKSSIKSDLETAFFGTSEQTGWESLSSYYYKSSYGKLDIKGTVTDVYKTGKKSGYYEKKYENASDEEISQPEYEILKGALEYFDDKIDYTQYDSDRDGFIDAVYLVYTAPVCRSKDESDFWWAFTYEYYTDNAEYYDGKEADYYMFFGYDFLFEEPACGKTIAYNSETIIHETGHVLGLDDYYDYGNDDKNNGGLGGGDMMDYNVGDHNPFSKMLLGWVDPYVAKDDCAITLGSFGKTGDCVMICKDDASPFAEYFIIDYYTPDGLNAFEAGNSGLFSVAGVRVYHVNATLESGTVYSLWDVYEHNNASTADNKLIALVEADGKKDIENEFCSDNSDLYSIGSTIGGLKWRNGKSAGFTVKIQAASSGVTLSISFN